MFVFESKFYNDPVIVVTSFIPSNAILPRFNNRENIMIILKTSKKSFNILQKIYDDFTPTQREHDFLHRHCTLYVENFLLSLIILKIAIVPSYQKVNSNVLFREILFYTGDTDVSSS